MSQAQCMVEMADGTVDDGEHGITWFQPQSVKKYTWYSSCKVMRDRVIQATASPNGPSSIPSLNFLTICETIF